MDEIVNTKGNESTSESISVQETTSSETVYSCCALASTVQPALRAKDMRSIDLSLCPSGMHSVEGLALNMEFWAGSRKHIHLCCDANTNAENVDTKPVKACVNEVDTADDDKAELRTTLQMNWRKLVVMMEPMLLLQICRVFRMQLH